MKRESLIDKLVVFTRICRVLGQMHELGMIHRLVQPGSILINDKGQVRLIDMCMSTSLKEDPTPVEGLFCFVFVFGFGLSDDRNQIESELTLVFDCLYV